MNNLGLQSRIPCSLTDDIKFTLDEITTTLVPGNNNQKILQRMCLAVEFAYKDVIFTHPELREKWKRDIDSLCQRVQEENTIIKIMYVAPSIENDWNFLKIVLPQ